jgi:hypothetical protein
MKYISVYLAEEIHLFHPMGISVEEVFVPDQEGEE